MENKAVGKDLVLEHVSVAGTLYVTIDKELLYAHKFAEHVKIKIVFDDKPDVERQNNEEPSSKMCGQSVGFKSKKSMDFFEGNEKEELDNGEDLLIDNTLNVNYDLKSKTMNDSPKIRTGTISAIQVIRGKGGRELEGESKIRYRDNKVSHAHCSFSKSQILSYRDSKLNVKDKLLSGNCLITRLPESLEKSKRQADFQGKVTPKEKKNRLKIRLERKEDIRCTYCSQNFKSNRDFAAHRKVESKNYPCAKCRKVLQFKAHLMIHMYHYHGQELSNASSSSSTKTDSGTENFEGLGLENGGKKTKRMKCHVCGIMVSNLANLKLHVMVHTGEFAFKCCVCGQLSRTISPHKKHMATHFKFGRVECKICKTTFGNRTELSKHQLTHTYTCNLCGQTFPNKTGRYFHYRTSHKTDILKCPECDRLYSSKTALEAHIRYHRNRRKTQCTVCGIFVYRLEKHMLSHSKSEEITDNSKMFICDKCPKQFKHKQAFQRHLSVHSEEKPYACTECSKQFAHSGGLNRHLKTHIPDKPFVCEVCGKACKQIGNLKIHMQTHKDSKPLTCNHCGTGFAHQKTLDNHINSVHNSQVNILKTAEQYFPTNSLYQMFT